MHYSNGDNLTEGNLLIKRIKSTSPFEVFSLPVPQFIVGPCAIENKGQIEEIAQILVANNIKIMRAGAYKPRTSPYSFQGLGLEGLKMLDYVRKKYGLLVISEIIDIRDIEYGLIYTDIIQIGSRNMSNTALLKEIGRVDHPVLLKRGMMATLSEFMFAAEYILKYGNRKLMLCERGIRTFEESVRNVLDIAAIALLKKETSLPVIVDLSHSLGRKDILLPVAKAVIALGVDGIMLEMHNTPERALSDVKQQLTPKEFEHFIKNIL